MDGPVPTQMFAVLSIVVIVGTLPRRFPDRWWARLLLTPVGPELETAGLDRGQLLRRAGWFGGAALVGLLTIGAALWLGSRLRPGDPLGVPPIAAIVFTFGLLGAVALAAGSYLVVRAWLRGARPADHPS